MQIVLVVVAVVLVFGAVIFVHELGHFIAAKKSGIKVNEFALGMGPRLLKVVRGETIYALRAFPVGGFVSMEGEDEESADSHSFTRAPRYKRAIVMLAGAVMNLLLGFLAMLVLVASSEGALFSLKIGQVYLPETGLQVGDEILKINGRRAFVYSDLQYEFARTQNGTFTLQILRDGEKLELENVSFPVAEATLPETGETFEYIDVGFRVYGTPKTFFSVLDEAFSSTLSNGRFIYLTLFDLITGRLPINSLSGPVGIVSEIGKAVSYGWQSVVQLLGILSINLGIVNMLPLPALDGGRCVLLLAEAIRRKPLKQKIEVAINLVGFGLLIVLMLVVSFNDIKRLAGF